MRLAVTTSLCGALLVTPALSAVADPDPVYPSQHQVDTAKAAAASTAQRVAALDASYAAANARLVEVQIRAAAAAEAFNGAQYELGKKQAAAQAARERAASAQLQADAASTEVRQYAAAVYQQGGSLGDLEAYLSSKGPQDLLDRASSLEAVGDARNRTLQRASATSVVADTMRRQAAQAEAQQLAAKQRAEQARSAAQAQADAGRGSHSPIQNEQQAMTAELAKLRKTSVALERERQDGLRAAAEARAAAAAAAEQARLAAARAAAARTAAARQAAARARQEAARQAAAAPRGCERPPVAPPRTRRPGPPRGRSPSPRRTRTPPPPPSTGGGVSAVHRLRAGPDRQAVPVGRRRARTPSTAPA